MQLNLWIAVCHEFHSARGPWFDPEECLKEAKRLTRESTSGCVYIPVLLKTEGQVMGDKSLLTSKKSEEKSDGTYRSGMYL